MMEGTAVRIGGQEEFEEPGEMMEGTVMKIDGQEEFEEQREMV